MNRFARIDRRLTFILILGLLAGCSGSDGLMDGLDVHVVQIGVFIVDARTFEFKSGVLRASEPCGDRDQYYFPLSSATAVGEPECGSIAFFHSEFGDTLFAGSSCWMGTGGMTHPRELLPANSFPIGETRHELPDIIELWSGNGVRVYPTEVSYDLEHAWRSIERLAILDDLTQGISHVGFYRYVPSLLIGESDPMKWIIMIYSRRVRDPLKSQ